MASESASSTPSQGKSTYTDRESRISKENLFMVLALQMERFPVRVSIAKEADPYRNVGAVLVLPNDMLHAADCTRNGVHGVARLLMKHYDVAKDCKIFVSRKPCSFCTKLLVQCQIKRVFYLPIEPEYKDVEEFKDEASRVDSLFKTSAISQSVFVPTIGSGVFESAEKRKETPQKDREDITKELMESYWKEEWINKAKDDLPWPAFDENMKAQSWVDVRNTMEWMARILIDEKKGYTFKAEARNETITFDPELNLDLEQKQASHLITMAKFLAQRSDDPKTGVGAVITNKALEIVALGFNGYPSKALYGEFPRGSHDDQVEVKKYPYAIHAEQNALLMRNTKNLEGGIMFQTKTPCNECTPLLEMVGIKTVVLSEKLQKKTSAGNLSYTKFPDKVQEGVFICFADLNEQPQAHGKKRKLDFEEKKALLLEN